MKSNADETVEIRGIWLQRQGDYITVQVWMSDGIYREVIREHSEGPISHCVHAGGIRGSSSPFDGAKG